MLTPVEGKEKGNLAKESGDRCPSKFPSRAGKCIHKSIVFISNSAYPSVCAMICYTISFQVPLLSILSALTSSTSTPTCVLVNLSSSSTSTLVPSPLHPVVRLPDLSIVDDSGRDASIRAIHCGSVKGVKSSGLGKSCAHIYASGTSRLILEYYLLI